MRLSAAVAVAAAATITTAAAAAGAATIPPDGARGTAAARGDISPTPPWTTARRDQPSETATTQRRRYQVTPAMTRSRSRRTGMSGAFALLEADEQIVRSLATEPKADGDPELPAALACDLETPETNAQAHAGPHGCIRGGAKSLSDLQRLGRLNRRGGVCDGHATVFRLDLCLLFWQPTPAFVCYYIYI